MKRIYFRVNKLEVNNFEVGVNDGIFFGNEQEVMQNQTQILTNLEKLGRTFRNFFMFQFLQ